MNLFLETIQNMRNSKKSSKSGGSFVSSGAYACTFSPPLACHDKHSQSVRKNTNTKSIGKVFLEREDGQQELEVYKLVQSLDPQSTFTVPMLKHCTIGEPSPENAMPLCDKSIKKHESIQLIYRHGGEDLWNIMESTKNSSRLYFELFQKLEPMLRGLQKLNANGWLHLDIKPDNIVYDQNKLYLIDFGLMTQMSKLASKKTLLDYDYPYYPPEFKLSLFATLGKGDFHNFEKAFFRNFAVLSVVDKAAVSRQLERYIALLKFRQTRPNQFDKADIYALGMTFLILYDNMVKTETSVGLLTHSLFSDMTNCNPFERPTWDEIIQRYKKIQLLVRGDQIKKKHPCHPSQQMKQ